MFCGKLAVIPAISTSKLPLREAGVFRPGFVSMLWRLSPPTSRVTTSLPSGPRLTRRKPLQTPSAVLLCCSWAGDSRLKQAYSGSNFRCLRRAWRNNVWGKCRDVCLDAYKPLQTDPSEVRIHLSELQPAGPQCSPLVLLAPSNVASGNPGRNRSNKCSSCLREHVLSRCRFDPRPQLLVTQKAFWCGDESFSAPPEVALVLTRLRG